jgi:DUF2993 family protein
MRRGRRFRWLAVILLVGVGLYFVLDVAARQYLQSRGGDQIARVMSAADAKLKLPGIPFLPGFLRGHIGEVEVEVIGASGPGGLRVQSIQARLSEVRFSPGKLFALARSSFATRTEVTAEQPVGLVELGEGDLEDYLRRMVPEVGNVLVKSTGVEVYFLKDLSQPAPDNPFDDQLTPPARFLPIVEDGKIILRLVGVAGIPPELRNAAARIEHIIDLPAIPKGLRTDVRLGKGVIVFESTGNSVTLQVGEGEPD